MDIKNLNSVIAKRVIDPNDLKIGDFVSRIDLDHKRINNRYFVTSIKTAQPKNKRKIVVKVRCYDFVYNKFEDFVDDELLSFIKPSCNDFYNFQFSGYDNRLEIGTHVTFIEPECIRINKEKTVFVITRCITDKYGAKFASIVDNNNNCLFNIPLPFLKLYDENQIELNQMRRDNMFKNDVQNSVISVVPKEPEDDKNLNFDFSINVNNKGIKFEFHDENHKLMSETSVDFNKDDLNNIGQVVGKYISNLIELNLELNKLNQDRRVKVN